MKIALQLIVFLFYVILSGCQKDQNLLTGNNSLTVNGTMSGSILNYVPGSVDSIKALCPDLIGENGISSIGQFTIDLSTPELLVTTGSMNGLLVSDTAAMTGSVYLCTYRGGMFSGLLNKSNLPMDSLNKAGISYSMFTYSDRYFTIKGTRTTTDLFNDSQLITTAKYDVIIKKGWNELVVKINSSSSTSCTTTISETVSNIITSDLQWRYSVVGVENVRRKTTGVNVLKLDKLFRME